MKYYNYLKCFLVGLLCCTSWQGFGQFSKTHYIPPVTAHINSNTSLPQEQYLYISTPTTTSFNVKITPVGGVPVNLTISNTTPIEYIIREKTANENNFSGLFSQLITPSNTTGGKFSDLGYVIEAESQVYVSVRILAGTNYEQGGALVSKGLAGLGKTFRVGAFPTLIRASDQNDFINGSATGKIFDDFLSFVSVMATEDNTTVDFSGFAPGVSILNNTPTSVNLNSGESYIVVLQSNEKVENFDGLIGVLVESTKPIAVNCGSFNGTNHDRKGSRDMGIDQIVPIERIGQEYIFVRARGNDDIEKPLIVAHQDNTDIFIDGGGVPVATLNAGDYYVVEGSLYGADGNIYVNTSKDAYAYQGIGGTTSAPNQGMFFVPPLNCKTPKIVDNIPFVKNVGQLGVIDIYESDGVTIKDTRDVSTFDAGLAIITQSGATVTVNGTNILSLGVPVVQQSVVGNSNYESYFIENLPASIDNVSIVSTGQLYVASFGANSNAALGGYYSGFEFKPEIILTDISASNLGTCIPNVELSLNDISYYDNYQWYLDGVAIPGANNISFIPAQPGYYHVEGQIMGCPPAVTSDVIPVSLCPPDVDNDDVNDNIDVDNDNDGILNCTESYGSESLDLINPIVGSVYSGNITFTGTIVPPAASTYITGFSDGHFNSNVPANENLEYQLNFSSPVNILFEYATMGSIAFSNDEVFAVTVPSTNTITLLDPDDQLLIDTDYDGIYEAGVTQFSSFDIRFKIKNNTLTVGIGTFGFYSHATNAFTFKHNNETLSTTNSNIPFKITAACIALDSDNDGLENALDLDSDNDSVPDVIESSGAIITLSNTDANQDGLDDIFGNGSTPADSDSDTTPDYLDLDSDNDGIYDLEESGSGLIDIDFDGIVDNANTIIGLNGWVDTAETTPDSGQIGFLVLDTDVDNIWNYSDLDADGDGCLDVTEAGFTDSGSGEIVGTGIDAMGVVIGSDGYTTPNSDYLIFKEITISSEPTNQILCELSSGSFNIVSDAEMFQWQIFDGSNWINIVDDTLYSGTNSSMLSITNAPFSLNGANYRVSLKSSGNACELLSQTVSLTVNQTLVPTGIMVQNFCAGSLDSLNNLVINGNNILWYEDTITTTPLPNATVLTDGVTYYASQTHATTGCESTSRLPITVQVIDVPSISNPGNQTICGSFNLPTITGVNLSGTQAYYDNSQANGGVLITGPITSSQIVWVYDSNSSCSDEVSFQVTIVSAPDISNPEDQLSCTSFTLPNILGANLSGNEAYYDDSQANGGAPITGAITSSQTVWIYDNFGSCSDEESFNVTILSIPSISNPGNQAICDAFVLPPIVGTNLTGNEAYYDNSIALGGNIITGTLTDSQMVYIYDSNGSCTDEVSFEVTILKTPSITNLGNQTVCDTFTLPAISGNHLSGTEAYYSDSQVNGGIPLTDEITSTQTIWIYDTNGSCSDEISFDVTIINAPVISNPGNQIVCDIYPLPVITGSNLSGKEAYYNDSQANGGDLINDPITNTQTVWMYDSDGFCSSEESFIVTINSSVKADILPDVVACDNYVLPVLSSGNHYFTDVNGTGVALFSSEIITESQTIYIYAAALAPCVSDQQSFNVTIVQTPEFTINDQTICPSSGSAVELIPEIINESGTYNYIWEHPDGTITTNNTLVTSLVGAYYLTISQSNTMPFLSCSSNRKVVEVKSAVQAIIDVEDIEIEEFSNNNSITIDESKLGSVEFVYAIQKAGSLDDLVYQEINFFDNIGFGEFKLYIKNTLGCDPIVLDFVVAGYPKYFTPNGDSLNEFWQVYLPHSTVMEGTKIFIFDRYGKLLKNLDPFSMGWDGLFNGRMLPTDDYWFQMILLDGRIFRSHFTLKR